MRRSFRGIFCRFSIQCFNTPKQRISAARKGNKKAAQALGRGSMGIAVFRNLMQGQENMLSILLWGIIATIVLPSGVYFGVEVAKSSSIILFISLFDSSES